MYEHKDQVAITSQEIMGRYKKIIETLAKKEETGREDEDEGLNNYLSQEEREEAKQF